MDSVGSPEVPVRVRLVGTRAKRQSRGMSRPMKLEHGIDAWLAEHEGWTREGEGAIARAYTFPDFASALAFVVHLGCLAERKDHHPEIGLGWGKVRVLFTTHDAGGLTRLDLEMAEAADTLKA
jgi:4a-hydroxytetrahydrobiopterin dehydratase